jgi:carbonic anhydrase
LGAACRRFRRFESAADALAAIADGGINPGLAALFFFSESFAALGGGKGCGRFVALWDKSTQGSGITSRNVLPAGRRQSHERVAGESLEALIEKSGVCMKTVNSPASLLAVLALSWTGTALAQHWGYEGEAAPQNWAKLDPKFAICESGKNQSPIDLSGFVEADLKPLKFAYKAGATEILNNGHTVQVDYAPGSSLTVGSRVFELKQFHFHSPSENTISGKQYPLEGHLVHADKDGNLAVVAVMFRQGAANALLTKLWGEMPSKAGDKNALPAGLSVSQMLPADRDYYRFNGSLTTPPCSEGVWWLVIKKTATASKAQIEQFSKVLPHANNRPVQPVNARPVLR